MRILLVEDDLAIGKTLKAGLEERCYSADWETDGERGSWMARTNDYDLVILDNMLPSKLGRDICVELRDSGKTMPILIHTVQGDLDTKIDMLEIGADDYVTKPFHFGELMARIQALLRRPPQIKSEILELGDLKVDTGKQEVTRAGEAVYLTRKEFQLLEYLLRNSDSVVSRGQILEHVWDVNADPFSNTIETHILNLRKKIDRSMLQKLIHTIPGRGYKIGAGK
jgi:DNA-binding response OmpR family regulator